MSLNGISVKISDFYPTYAFQHGRERQCFYTHGCHLLPHEGMGTFEKYSSSKGFSTKSASLNHQKLHH
jgi:hypothetical protein